MKTHLFNVSLLIGSALTLFLVAPSDALAQATATTTTLVSSANPVVIGQPVTYTVTVTGGAPLTGPVRVTFNGNNGPDYALHNGSVVIPSTAAGPPRTLTVIAYYLGDANTLPSSSTPLNEVVVAGSGVTPTTISVASSVNPAYVGQTITYTATVIGSAPTGTVNFFAGSSIPFTITLGANGTATIPDSYPAAGTYAITATYSGDSRNAGSASAAIGQVIVAPVAQPPLQFVPVSPCRIADTRNAAGPFGGPAIAGGQVRAFAIPLGACGIPSTAAAYSLNVTVVPTGPLNYLTLWPAGQPAPTVSLLNSFDGRVKANAAIVPAGAAGAINVYANAATATQIVLDIDGYFLPATSASLEFYPLTPCRLVDTRTPAGPLGGPYLSAGTSRALTLAGACQIPPTAQAYSLNITAIPAGPLNFMTVWPTGVAQPLSSTLNAPTGTITANAAIVPAGTGGSVTAFTTNDSDMLIDVNGYFAPPGAGGLSLYTTTPCRIYDTRNYPYSPFPGTFTANVQQSYCTVPAAAAAFVLNATIIPPGAFNYLSLWPAGATQTAVSTLNAMDGAVTSNMAIVPVNNGSIDAYATDPTQLVLDISSYFAP